MEEACHILEKIYAPHEVQNEIQELKNSVEEEGGNDKGSVKVTYIDLFRSKEIRLALIAGVGLQVKHLYIQIVVYLTCKNKTHLILS